MTRSPVRGAAAGLATALVGYALAYATTAGDLADELDGVNLVLSLLGQQPVPTWKGVGWLAYNALFVPLTYANRSRNLLADASPLVHVAPCALLALAGASVTLAANTRTAVAGARTGALVTLGFLPAAVVGVSAVTVTRGGFTVRPDPLLAVVAGALYPLAFGALGGALAGWLRGRAPPVRPTN